VIEFVASRRLACRSLAGRSGSSGERQANGDPCDEAKREKPGIKLARMFPLRSTERAAGERTLEPRIGWITYLPTEVAAKAKYPADVAVEALADGAALVTLCEEPFAKSDAEGLARPHALEATLRPLQS
jgi:hypothetical protein